jgi:hypothetical protein
MFDFEVMAQVVLMFEMAVAELVVNKTGSGTESWVVLVV